MDPAIAGALVGAGFTALTAVTTQLIASHRESRKDAAARHAAKAQELRDTLEPAAMTLSGAIRMAEAALKTRSAPLPLAEITDVDSENLARELDIAWKLQAQLALRLGPETPTSSEYTRAAEHLNSASQARDEAAARRELDVAAAHRDKFLAAAADAFGTAPSVPRR